MITINIPESWNEVTIRQFQEIIELDTDETNKTIDIISILTNEDPETIRKTSIESMTNIIPLLAWTNEMPNDAFYKPILKIDDDEFGMISKLESLTTGEWIDIDNYLKEPLKNIHNIMSILYRPLITAFNDRDRLIDEYNVDVAQRQAERFKDHIMIGDVYGALIFFYLIRKEYIQIMQDYLSEERIRMEVEMELMTKLGENPQKINY